MARTRIKFSEEQESAHRQFEALYALYEQYDPGGSTARVIRDRMRAIDATWGAPEGFAGFAPEPAKKRRRRKKPKPPTDWERELALWIGEGGDPSMVIDPDVVAPEIRHMRMGLVGAREIDAAMSPVMRMLDDYDPEAPINAAAAERKAQIVESMIAFHDEMTTLNRDLVSTALQDSFDQLGGFGDAMVAMNDLFAVELPRFSDMWRQMGEEGMSGADMLATTAPKMLDLSKRIVGGLIKDKKAHSIVLGLFEVAQGLASAVTVGRQWESAGHFAAATAYFIAAGKSGGGGKGAAKAGAGAGAAGRGITPTRAGGSMPPPQINIHVGTLIGDDEIAIRNLASKLNRHATYTGGGSEIP